MSKHSARALRKRMTDAERLLWRHLRNRELDGWKFRGNILLVPLLSILSA
jgi:very-short-patch-repair endonuclease